MKAGIAVALVCAIVGGALPSAVAQVGNPAVADWKEFCWATHGASAAALELASAAGWDVKPGEKSAYKVAPGDTHSLLAGDNLQTGLPLCTTSAPVVQGAKAPAALEALLGHPPTYVYNGWVVWAFDRKGDTLNWISNDNPAAGNEASSNGRLLIVETSVIGKLDIVKYEMKEKGWQP